MCSSFAVVLEFALVDLDHVSLKMLELQFQYFRVECFCSFVVHLNSFLSSAVKKSLIVSIVEEISNLCL